MGKDEHGPQKIAIPRGQRQKAKRKHTRSHRSSSIKGRFARFCQIFSHFPLIVQVLVMLVAVVLVTNPAAMAGLVNLIRALKS